MPTYRVEFTPTARKQIDALDGSVRKRVDAAVVKLEVDPSHAGVITLQGGDGIRRVRVGDWRILFTVDGPALLVLVLEVAHRGEAYR